MRVLFLTLFIVISDQVTKLLVKGGSIPFLHLKVEGMQYGQSINVIGDFFKITFVENPGIAFGIDVNNTSKLLLSIFSLLASIGIFYYLWKSRYQKLIVRLALAFVLGGAIGNLIDRTFYGMFYGYAPIFDGKVVDFFNFDFFDFTIFGRTFDRFPIFNIADSCITIGVALLILFYRPHAELETTTISSPVPDSIISSNEAAGSINRLAASNQNLKNGQDSNREENKD